MRFVFLIILFGMRGVFGGWGLLSDCVALV